MPWIIVLSPTSLHEAELVMSLKRESARVFLDWNCFSLTVFHSMGVSVLSAPLFRMNSTDSCQHKLLVKSEFCPAADLLSFERLMPEIASFVAVFFLHSKKPEASADLTLEMAGGRSFLVRYCNASLYPFLSKPKST